MVTMVLSSSEWHGTVLEHIGLVMVEGVQGQETKDLHLLIVGLTMAT